MHNFSFIFLFEILDWSRIWTLYSISLSFIFWKRLSSFFYFISLLMISKCIVYRYTIMTSYTQQIAKIISLQILVLKRLALECALEKVALHEILQTYRIVACTNTCYYSENQIFCFLKSRILTCRIFFFRNKTFLFVIRSLRYPTYLTNT